jgi:high-affinity nickel-transport protein
MLGAYGWAFVTPMRKLYDNLKVTLISVLVAYRVRDYDDVRVLIAPEPATRLNR